VNPLREYIKELLTEAAKGPQDLPAGVFVKIEPDPHGVTIFYATENGRPTKTGSGIEGEILLETLDPDEPLGPCGGAWMIGSAEASTGWGPMLYDVAMEYATMNGGGLISDRGSVSSAARKVWDYYMSNRGDVTGIQLDDPENTLTPEEEDNCDQEVAGGFTSKYSRRKEPENPDWMKSPLSKRWTKPPTTIGALKAAGKLIWQEWVEGRPKGVQMVESYIRELLKEDPMGFVHDLAAASEDFGEDFFGGDPGKGGGKAIKRAFNANADHQWLSTLDTVHWVEDAYSLERIVGKSKDELSTTMTLPGDKLKNPPGMLIGLWVKGRITLAANDQDQLFTGKWHDYMGAHASYTGEEQEQRQKSSGINKLPQVSKDYSRYGQLKRGDEFAEKMARNAPYVLDQSTWHQADWSNTNEALVDNWKPVGIVVGKWLEPIKPE